MRATTLVAGCICGLTIGALLRSASAAEPSPDDIEFFEKQVRPVLVETCQKCHGQAKQEGGLRLDSRSGALKGGDSGPVVDPGKPEESLLIEAIGYGGDIKMPPKAKLSDERITALTEWVKRGAPWPADAPGANRPGEFNLEARKAKQWALQPVRPQSAPAVKNSAWPATPIDNFVLARLEAAGLSPAPQAEKQTLIRRATFDLAGLPPTPAEIDAFLADDSPQAFERVIERLLDSPHYGERWARHWLDLVRFAETCGHEFDFEIPYAYEYRDYVIRALNADLPYDQFVIEHLAGDLLPEPRRHPAERFDESIIGTGFWFLGEAKHSPVDVRADEADRMDNQIDVFGKAILAQTLGCARCHDHKFDAISTKDYYALAGYLQSSRYAVTCIDRPDGRLQLVRQLRDLYEKQRTIVDEAVSGSSRDTGENISNSLLAAMSVLRPEGDKSLDTAATGSDPGDRVFEDFEKPEYAGWTATGNAFGERPNRRPLPEYQGEIEALGQGFVNSHSALDKAGNRTATDELTGTLTSRVFKIERPYIHFLIGGGAHAGKTCLNLMVDGKVARSATGRNENRMDWGRFDVRDLAEKEARFEIVDQEKGGWGNIGVDQIVFSQSAVPGRLAARLHASAQKYSLDPAELEHWVAAVQQAARESGNPLHLWGLLADRNLDLSGAGLTRFLDVQRGALKAADERAQAEAEKLIVFANFSKHDFSDWFVAGEAFGAAPVELSPSLPGAPFPTNVPGALSARVAHSGFLASRLEGALRSKTFTIEKNHLLYHFAGKGAKVNLIIDSYQLIRNPIYGGLAISVDSPERMRWHVQDVSKWVGHNAYIELIDPGEGFLAVDRILFSDGGPPGEPVNAVSRTLLERQGIDSVETLARACGDLVEHALEHQHVGKPPALSESDRVAGVALFNALAMQQPVGRRSAQTAERLHELSRSKVTLEQSIHYRRRALTMIDGSPEDDRVHVRGSPHKFGEVVPRRLLESLAGGQQAIPERGSGRLELARRVVDPSNPLIARVIVNRVWKHHFGEGLVRTPDDFGNMGQPPTHPELLDSLAADFIKNGWSLKRLHKLLMISQTYRMASSSGDARGEELDPQNRLYHRANIRRLEAEAIRDAILAVSGRLDPKMFGPGIAPYLTAFMIGRGRPAQSGPLDGDGRRTLYLNVRRNFLTPMLLAFDYPVPFSTIGRRSVSNVPAQALALMNNPFVLQQADVWAKRVLAERSETVDRIQAMYLAAFGRLPTEIEMREAREFLTEQSRQYAPGEALRPWADFAHVLFNVKEFIFVE